MHLLVDCYELVIENAWNKQHGGAVIYCHGLVIHLSHMHIILHATLLWQLY